MFVFVDEDSCSHEQGAISVMIRLKIYLLFVVDLLVSDVQVNEAISIVKQYFCYVLVDKLVCNFVRFCQSYHRIF